MIRPISATEALVVRHPVLRPGLPLEDAIFTCDNDETTRHLGAFDEAGRLVGVVTVHPAACPVLPAAEAEAAAMGGEVAAWQLRGMGTLPEARGRGHGKALVREAERRVREAGGSLLWCNARVVALSFYGRLGWEVVGEEFDIPTVGPHFVMRRRL